MVFIFFFVFNSGKKSVPFSFYLRFHQNLGEKTVPILVKTFFFGLHLNLGKKLFQFWWRPFFLVQTEEFGEDHLICLPEKNSWSRFIPPTSKLEQNWGKIANYRPNAQQRFAPLPTEIHKVYWKSIITHGWIYQQKSCYTKSFHRAEGSRK